MRARRENQPKITPRGLPERAVRRIVYSFAPGGDSASNLVVSRRLWALPGTLFGSPGRPWPEPARRPGGLERPRIDPSCLDWPPRPTKSTQHRSKRPLDRPKSTEDRPKRPPRDDSGRRSATQLSKEVTHAIDARPTSSGRRRRPPNPTNDRDRDDNDDDARDDTRIPQTQI